MRKIGWGCIRRISFDGEPYRGFRFGLHQCVDGRGKVLLIVLEDKDRRLQLLMQLRVDQNRLLLYRPR